MAKGLAIRIVLLTLLASMLTLPVQAQSSDSTSEEKGLVEVGVYESPQFSNQVTWTDEWKIDDEGLQTDDALLLDQISLNYKNQGTAVIMFLESGGESPDAYALRLMRYRRVAEPLAEVVWSDSDENSSILLFETIVDGRDVASLIEIRLVDDDETLQVVELLIYPEYAETVFETAQSDIEIDGVEPFSFVDDFPLSELKG